MTTGNLTIQDNETVVQYTAVGELTFVFSFPILAAAELRVSRNQLQLTYGVDYSITGIGDDGGGFITLLGGASTPGDVWTLWQDMPIERLTGFSAGAATITGSALNAEFAARLRVEQQLRREIRNSIRLAPDDPVGDQDMVLPTSDRVGKYLVFGAGGVPTYASGTGADAGLRTDLAAGVSGLVRFTSLSYDQTAAELAAAVNPTTALKAYEPGDPRRYTTIANQAAVLVQINTLARYTGWYRGDRAQHQQLTNVVLGLGAYDDSQMTSTLGYRCTAIGVNVLKNNKASTLAGGSNTAGGFGSQENSVDTSGNTSWGTFTLASCTGVSSAHNGAFGNSALEALISGTQNNGFAYRAMFQLVRGDNNTGSGDVVLQGLIAGNAHTCYGAQSGFTKPGGNFLCAYGYQSAFHENAALISAITKAASAQVTLSLVSGANPYVINDYVTFSDVGGMTQMNNLSAIVTNIGGVSGAWTVTVAINSTGFSTYTAGGYCAPYGNCIFGVKGQFENTYASGNTTYGTEIASTAVLGPGNTISGFQGGRVINGASFNTLSGWRVALLLSSGTGNVVTGASAAPLLTTGSNNLIEGNNAGSGMTTGIRCTILGNGAAATGNWNNVTALGFNAQPIADNTVTIGDTNIIQIRAQVTVITAISDLRYKINVQPLLKMSELIRGVTMVRFNWDNTKQLLDASGQVSSEEDGLDWSSEVQVGVTAQNLDEQQRRCGLEWLGLVDKTNPHRWEATPGKLLFPLIASHQELYNDHDALRAEQAELLRRLTAVEARLAD